MKKQIVRVSPLQTAKVFAVLSFVMSLPMLLFMVVPMMFSSGPTPGFFRGMMLAMPFFYAFFGFLFALIGAWVYNLLTPHIGGIEFNLQDTPEA